MRQKGSSARLEARGKGSASEVDAFAIKFHEGITLVGSVMCVFDSVAYHERVLNAGSLEGEVEKGLF